MEQQTEGYSGTMATETRGQGIGSSSGYINALTCDLILNKTELLLFIHAYQNIESLFSTIVLSQYIVNSKRWKMKNTLFKPKNNTDQTEIIPKNEYIISFWPCLFKLLVEKKNVETICYRVFVSSLQKFQ